MRTTIKRLHSKLLVALVISATFLFLCVSSVLAATVELVALREPRKPGVFPVFVFVDSENVTTIGTDLLIEYDPTAVQFEKIEFLGLYSQEHEVQHDVVNHTIRFSGTNEYDAYTVVNGNLAIVFFSLLQRQPANKPFLLSDKPPIRLRWLPEATDDTNVVSAEGADLLTSKPLPLRLDPKYSIGQVQGVFDDAQLALLAEDGILQISDPIPSKVNLRTATGIILILSSGYFFYFFFIKKKRKKEKTAIQENMEHK